MYAGTVSKVELNIATVVSETVTSVVWVTRSWRWNRTAAVPTALRHGYVSAAVVSDTVTITVALQLSGSLTADAAIGLRLCLRP